jgi:hypothetical protein
MAAAWKTKAAKDKRRALRKLLGKTAKDEGFDLRKPPTKTVKRALSRHKASVSEVVSGAKVFKAKSAKSYAALRGSGAKPLRGRRFLVSAKKLEAADKFKDKFKGNLGQRIKSQEQFILDAFAKHDRYLAASTYEEAEKLKLSDEEYRAAVYQGFVFFGDDERVRNMQDSWKVAP